MKEEVKKKPNRRPKFLSSFEEEKEFLLENLSMLVDSGMDVGFALESIQREIKSKTVKEMVKNLQKDILEGVPLWIALDKTELFARNVISLVKMGEQSGKLPKNLKAIALQERKERSFRSKVRSAMLYPAFVFTLTLVIGVGIAWFLLPKLAGVFASLKLQLPLITRVLIQIGTFLKDYGIFAVPAIIIFSASVCYFVFFFRRTKFIGEYILFLFPAARTLITQIELSRFGYVLATLVDSGLSITEAIESLRDATGFSMYRKLYQHVLDSIKEGNSFQDSFASYKKSGKLIPFSVQQMIAFAEQSGNLIPTFRTIGDNYEEKVETTTKDLATLLEPVLLVIVWLGVVSVALAVILPIYSLIGGLSEQNSPGSSTPPPIEETAIEKEPIQTDVQIEQIENLISPKIMIEILPTSTGFLNVREEASQQSRQITRVNPGESFEMISESNGWYQIKVSEEISGWVSAAYSRKISE